MVHNLERLWIEENEAEYGEITGEEASEMKVVPHYRHYDLIAHCTQLYSDPATIQHYSGTSNE